MYVRVTVEHCSKCDDLTPHSRRAIALPLVIGVASLLVSVLAFALARTGNLVSAFFVLVAALAFFQERRTRWRIRCERCRAKRAFELRRRRPSLPGGSEISFF